MKAPLELSSETTSANFHRSFSKSEKIDSKQTLRKPGKTQVHIGCYEQQPYRSANEAYGAFGNPGEGRERYLPKPNQLFHGKSKPTFDTTYTAEFPKKSCKRGKLGTTIKYRNDIGTK